MIRPALVFAGLSGAMLVALAAATAHVGGTKSAEALRWIDIAQRYHAGQTLALLPTAVIADRWPGAPANAALVLFAIGILLFSGSLYMMALADLTWARFATPFGGTAFIAGWLALAWHGWRYARV